MSKAAANDRAAAEAIWAFPCVNSELTDSERGFENVCIKKGQQGRLRVLEASKEGQQYHMKTKTVTKLQAPAFHFDM